MCTHTSGHTQVLPSFAVSAERARIGGAPGHPLGHVLVSNTAAQEAEAGPLGEMANPGTKAGNTQDKPGASRGPEGEEVLAHTHTGHVDGAQQEGTGPTKKSSQ